MSLESAEAQTACCKCLTSLAELGKCSRQNVPLKRDPPTIIDQGFIKIWGFEITPPIERTLIVSLGSHYKGEKKLFQISIRALGYIVQNGTHDEQGQHALVHAPEILVDLRGCCSAVHLKFLEVSNVWFYQHGYKGFYRPHYVTATKSGSRTTYLTGKQGFQVLLT